MSEAEANIEGWRGTDEGSKLSSKEELWADHNLEENPELVPSINFEKSAPLEESEEDNSNNENKEVNDTLEQLLRALNKT